MVYLWILIVGNYLLTSDFDRRLGVSLRGNFWHCLKKHRADCDLSTLFRVMKSKQGLQSSFLNTDLLIEYLLRCFKTFPILIEIVQLQS